MQNNQRFCRNGIYINRDSEPIFYLKSRERECVRIEIQAQMDLFISKFGFTPSHIDSHHHLHVEWGFTRCVIDLAKKYGVESIRLAQNTGSTALHKKIYRNSVNWYLGQKGFKLTKKFGSIDDLYISGFDTNQNYEIMVHARLSEDSVIVDIDSIDLESKLKRLYDSHNRILSNYRSLKFALKFTELP